MSNNLVRQIVKAGGSLFVGASIAIGTFCPIVLSSTPALTYSTWVDIPNDAATELNTLVNQGINAKTIAFTPAGGWVILNGSNGYQTNNIPQDALDELATLQNQNSTIKTIAFTPTGEWVIIFGDNDFSQSSNFPQDALDELTTLNKQGLTIDSVTFTPNNDWVIISNKGSNANWSSNFPQDVIDEISTIKHQNNLPISSITFTPNGEWVIISDYGLSANWSKNFPQNAKNAIVTTFDTPNFLINIAFTPSNGFVLLYKQDKVDFTTPNYFYNPGAGAIFDGGLTTDVVNLSFSGSLFSADTPAATTAEPPSP